MQLAELRFCARYPFSKDAKELMQKQGIQLGNISDEVVSLAVSRIDKLLSTDTSARCARWNEINSSQESFLVNEILAFPVSKIIVALSGDRLLLRRYAQAEAALTRHFLHFETYENIFRLASSLFPLGRSGDRLLISFADYLKFLPQGGQFRLVNQELGDGKVAISKDVLGELVAEYVARTIIGTKASEKDVPKILIFHANEIKKRHSAEILPEDLGEVDTHAFPPCMKRIVAELQTPEKVGHNARFVLATFAASINMPIDQALDLFRGQPNFDEKKTRYHLEHAYGVRSAKVKYSAPACEKMNSYGLCRRDSTCLWKHPMSYYKAQKRKLSK